MPQSIKARFNGNTEEVIEYTRLWGKHKAMDKYGIRDYVAFTKFIEGETGNPNFALCPTLGGSGNNSWAEDLLDPVLIKFGKLEAKIQSLEDELHVVRLKNEYLETQQALKTEPKVSQIMAKCRA